MATSSSDNPLLNLPTLAAIASRGSFSKAAEALDLNRAAISKRIAQMEKALGVPVLARTTRKVELTLAGKALLSRHFEAETILHMAIDEARGSMLATGGMVRVMCANSSLAVHLIAPALVKFAQARPSVQVDLIGATGDVANAQPDIELRITDAPALDRSARLLSTVSWSFQATARYLRRHGVPVSPHDLSKHRFVTPAIYNRPEGFEHRTTGEVTVVQPQNLMTSNIQEVVYELVKRGEAIGLIPNYLSSTTAPAVGLTEILTDWKLQNLPAQSIYAIHSPAKYQRTATREVLEYLVSACSSRV